MVGRSLRDRGRGHALTPRTPWLRAGVLAALTIGYALALARFTLGPASATGGGLLAEWARAIATVPGLGWVSFSVLEFLANIALFIPLGILVVAWCGRRRWWWAAPAGLATSAVIETIQGLWLGDRVADVRDLMSNTLGALVGALLAVAILRLLRFRRPRQARTEDS